VRNRFINNGDLEDSLYPDCSVARQFGAFPPMGVRRAILRSIIQMANLLDAVAANTARDVGGRLAAIAIWGTKANGGKYAAISALTNILATLLAYSFYEFVLKDSSRGTSRTIFLRLAHAESRIVVVTLIGKEFRDGHAAHIEHRTYHFGHHRDGVMGFGSSLDSEKGGSERSNNET
jgi:hypothetical protein